MANEHGQLLMVAAPPNFRSDQNDWGGDLSKKLNLGGGAKF